MSLKLPKHEKLKSRKTIALLFSDGISITKYPVRLIYLRQENQLNTQAAFAVPKKKFKLAVDRNRLKRLMREAYRMHKNTLNSDSGNDFALLFLYIGKDVEDFGKIEKALAGLLHELPE